ncbi:hypothetical protein CCICO_07665 [Corynebacterium ciconiae DSM 44920]|uniref:DUF4307 domain-containing protein n=1 Tax=Corynebacterium ciconiae TaxID=227319 RepID=UPI00038277EB|nr:DUF4307 domain-containing protein [Corynebacterium ciconiae]WKD61553.1 hypothetical protein CCICO_07665 [Corynebacterium ciconiae DSM 44920]
MPTPTSQPRNRSTEPTATYDSDRGTISGKLIAVGAVIFAIVAVVVIVQYFNKLQAGSVDGQVTKYERVEDNLITATVDITRDDVDKPAYCIVTAMNYDAVEVGRREIYIPAGGERTTRHDTSITTRDIPVVADLYGCSNTIPDYLKGDS